MRSLSEDMRILLQGRGGEAQPGDAPRRMVFQQALLVGLEQEPLDALTGQEEEPPVGVLDELGTGGLVLLQVEHDVGERRHREVGRGDPLVDRPLEYAEVPEGREEPLGDPAGRLLRPFALGLALGYPVRRAAVWTSSTSMSVIPRPCSGTSHSVTTSWSSRSALAAWK